jgi:WD40 repeat protein
LATSGTYNSPARIWEVATGRLLVTSQQTDLGSYPIVWSPDGSRLACPDNTGDVIVWEAATGKTLLTYRGHALSFGKSVLALAWSPDGTRLASGGEDQTIQIWEAASGKRLLTYTHPDLTISFIGTKAISWSTDGAYIVCSANKATLIWDSQTGKTRLSYAPLWQLSTELTFAAAWSPDGTRIVSGAGNTVRVWRPQ